MSALAVAGLAFAPWARFPQVAVVCLSALVHTVSAAGLSDLTADASLVGANVTIDDGGKPSICEEIIFSQRVSGHDHWYGNFGHYSDGHQGHYAPASNPSSVEYFKYAFGDGGRLCRFNLRTRKLTVVTSAQTTACACSRRFGRSKIL